MKNKFTSKFAKTVEDKPLNPMLQQADIKSKIAILDELRDFIVPLSEQELKTLEQSILQEGILDPIILWLDIQNDRYLIVDGHHRYGIAQSHSLDFPFKTKEFENIDKVKDFMLAKQLGRRNLTQEQLAYYRGLYYKTLTSEQKEKGEKSTNIAEALSDQFNVSPRTIKNDGKFAEHLEALPQDIKQEVLSGHSEITKTEILDLSQDEIKQIETLDDLKKTSSNKKKKISGANSAPEMVSKSLKTDFKEDTHEAKNIVSGANSAPENKSETLENALEVDDFDVLGDFDLDIEDTINVISGANSAPEISKAYSEKELKIQQFKALVSSSNYTQENILEMQILLDEIATM